MASDAFVLRTRPEIGGDPRIRTSASVTKYPVIRCYEITLDVS
ncbi:MAG: hypothetical protein JWM36_2158 [Hyphomicrobiales bacterium]|nr:hypothetical protein [Hyphomicrobiales bacterium]